MNRPVHPPLDTSSLRRDITFTDTLLGHRLSFHTTWGLFSPKRIDEGSRLLLQQIEVNKDARVLDLGCGYGALGLPIARSAPLGHCLMVDKDFVAVEYAQRNAKRNEIKNVSVMLSNGLDQVSPQEFDLVVTNLPAKTNKEHYYLIFNEIREHLTPGGCFYLVAISGLRRFIERAFVEIFGNHTKLKQGKAYTVACAKKLPAKPNINRSAH